MRDTVAFDKCELAVIGHARDTECHCGECGKRVVRRLESGEWDESDIVKWYRYIAIALKDYRKTRTRAKDNGHPD